MKKKKKDNLEIKFLYNSAQNSINDTAEKGINFESYLI